MSFLFSFDFVILNENTFHFSIAFIVDINLPAFRLSIFLLLRSETTRVLQRRNTLFLVRASKRRKDGPLPSEFKHRSIPRLAFAFRTTNGRPDL